MERELLLVYEKEAFAEKVVNFAHIKKILKKNKSLKSVKDYSFEELNKKDGIAYWKAILFLKDCNNINTKVNEVRQHCDVEMGGEICVILQGSPSFSIADGDTGIAGVKRLIKTKTLSNIADWWPPVLHFLFWDPNLDLAAKTKLCVFLFNGDATSVDEEELQWYNTAADVIKKFGLTCVWLGDQQYMSTRTAKPPNYKVLLARGDATGMWNKSEQYLASTGPAEKTLVYTNNNHSDVCKHIKESFTGTKIYKLQNCSFSCKQWAKLLTDLNLIVHKKESGDSDSDSDSDSDDDDDDEELKIWMIVLIVVLVIFTIPIIAGLCFIYVCFGIDLFQYIDCGILTRCMVVFGICATAKVTPM